MQYRFAHLSDIHLGPMPLGAFLHDFALKRVFGGLSWSLNRRRIHIPAIADLMVADIQTARPDHVACTGDLANVSAEFEFARGLRWLKKLGAVDDVSFTPGNHDAYVKVKFDTLGLFKPYMTSDMRQSIAADAQHSFPYIRLRRNTAFIGLSTACPQGLFMAGGTLGGWQIKTLSEDLAELKTRGFYRVVLLHHPPLPGLAKPRKALTDAAELRDVLLKHGAELVLHGHNHKQMFNWLDANPPIPIHGVASASSSGHGHHVPAAWHMYEIDRAKGQWRTKVTVRSYSAPTHKFETTAAFELRPATI